MPRETLFVRLPIEKKRLIQAAARQANMTDSEYCLDRLLKVALADMAAIAAKA